MKCSRVGFSFLWLEDLFVGSIVDLCLRLGYLRARKQRRKPRFESRVAGDYETNSRSADISLSANFRDRRSARLTEWLTATGFRLRNNAQRHFAGCITQAARELRGKWHRATFTAARIKGKIPGSQRALPATVEAANTHRGIRPDL